MGFSDDGIHRDQPEKIGVKVIVKGSEITVDLTNSPQQRPNALNTPYGGSTCVAVYSLFRFNPKFPAATQIWFCPANRVADLILQALTPVLPERSTAGNSAQLNGMYMSGTYDSYLRQATPEGLA